MFRYWNKVDQLNHLNRLLLAFVISQTVIIVGLIITLAVLPKHYQFWLTPAMATNGGLMKEGEIPPEYVQGFVATLLPSLNTWSTSGSHEFSNNINSYRYYFTPRHQQLMDTMLKTYKDNQIFSRIQMASLYQFMRAGDVKAIGHNAWEVHLVMRITQRLKNNSPMIISDKVVDYRLRVVKVSMSRLQNPFQLALDGYAAPEQLVQDLLATSLEEEKHEAN